MIGRLMLFVSLLAVGFVGGCSPYVAGFYYAPHPAVAEIQIATTQPSQAAEAAPVTTYATVVGIRRGDSNMPPSIEVRMRMDNRGFSPVNFDPRTLDITNSTLMRFPPAIVEPPSLVSIPPGQSVSVRANFPFAPGDSYSGGGMGTLQLHWSVQIDGQVVPQVAAFHRIHPYYYDPYWDYPPYPYGYPYFGLGGAVIIRR